MYGGKPNKNKINSKQSSDHKWQINVINIKLSKLNLVFNGVNTLNAKRYKTKRKASSTHKKTAEKGGKHTAEKCKIRDWNVT